MQTIHPDTGQGAGQAPAGRGKRGRACWIEGNTIPFIARYRKELHGAMDDTALRKLEDRLQYLRNLETAPAGGEVRHRRARAS